MNFLAPLFLLGALAVAAPILFHLIRRTTREVTPFSSLMFLRPTPPRVTKRSRLENLWLLLLRCLILALLARGICAAVFTAPDRLAAAGGEHAQAHGSARGYQRQHAAGGFGKTGAGKGGRNRRAGRSGR